MADKKRAGSLVEYARYLEKEIDRLHQIIGRLQTEKIPNGDDFRQDRPLTAQERARLNMY